MSEAGIVKVGASNLRSVCIENSEVQLAHPTPIDTYGQEKLLTATWLHMPKLDPKFNRLLALPMFASKRGKKNWRALVWCLRMVGSERSFHLAPSLCRWGN
jgi:hypothetical protein